MSTGEMAAASGLDNDMLSLARDNGQRYQATVAAYQARWEKLQDAKSSLDSEILEAEVLWGDKVKKIYEPIYGLCAKLFLAIQQQMEADHPDADKEDKEFFAKEWKSRRAIMYGRGAKDEFDAELTQHIKSAEDFLRPHLNRALLK